MQSQVTPEVPPRSLTTSAEKFALFSRPVGYERFAPILLDPAIAQDYAASAMATVTQYWNPGTSCMQLHGTVLTWKWDRMGDEAYYWGFSARPFQMNEIVSLEAPITAQSDNDDNQATFLTVAVNGGPRSEGQGTFIRFTAIKVTTP